MLRVVLSYLKRPHRCDRAAHSTRVLSHALGLPRTRCPTHISAPRPDTGMRGPLGVSPSPHGSRDVITGPWSTAGPAPFCWKRDRTLQRKARPCGVTPAQQTPRYIRSRSIRAEGRTDCTEHVKSASDARCFIRHMHHESQPLFAATQQLVLLDLEAAVQLTVVNLPQRLINLAILVLLQILRYRYDTSDYTLATAVPILQLRLQLPAKRPV